MCRKTNILNKKLIIAVIAISSVASLIVSSSQIYFSWINRKAEYLEQVDSAAIRNLNSIERSVWYLDQKQVESILSALTSDASILRAEVVAEGRAGIFAVSGSLTAKYDFDKVWPLISHDGGEKVLGSLRIFGSYEALEKSLIRQAIFILLSNMAKGILISIVLLAVFDRIVTRHILDIVAHLYRFNPSDIAPIKRRIVKKRDEIDFLMDAINDMQGAIEQAIAQERVALQEKSEYMARVNEMSVKVSTAEIATVVLHDINNILGGLVAVTMRAKKSRDSGDGSAALAEMITGVERINSLITGMIHAQQNVATGMETNWDRIDVKSLVKDAVMVEQ